MRKCWQKDPRNRPSFLELLNTLTEIEVENTVKVERQVSERRFEQPGTSRGFLNLGYQKYPTGHTLKDDEEVR